MNILLIIYCTLLFDCAYILILIYYFADWKQKIDKRRLNESIKAIEAYHNQFKANQFFNEKK